MHVTRKKRQITVDEPLVKRREAPGEVERNQKPESAAPLEAVLTVRDHETGCLRKGKTLKVGFRVRARHSGQCHPRQGDDVCSGGLEPLNQVEEE